MPDPIRLVLTLVAGLLSGTLSAAFGVGGAIVTTPAIRALGVGPLDAIGTTLPAILPSAVTGGLRYHRERLIRWRVVRWTGAVGAVATVAGAALVRTVPGEGHLLMLVTAGFTGFTAARILVTPRAAQPVDPAGLPEEPPAPADRCTPPRLAAIGVVAGLLSGLLGIGGGIVMVPAFTAWLRLPIKETVGTSLVCVGVLAVPGSIAHAALGGIDWWYALPLMVAVVPGARIGAGLAIRASERALRIGVAAALGVIAAIYAAAELASLVG